MSPTTWTELTAPDNGWTEGVPEPGVEADDYFIDFLFEGTLFFNNIVSHTELSVGAASYTEVSVAASSWTEVTA